MKVYSGNEWLGDIISLVYTFGGANLSGQQQPPRNTIPAGARQTPASKVVQRTSESVAFAFDIACHDTDDDDDDDTLGALGAAMPVVVKMFEK